MSEVSQRPSPIPGHRRDARIAGLDGLRAFSISLVLLGHLAGMHDSDPNGFFVRAMDFFHLAPLGVRIFFVISGFLITTLLIDEEARTGTVSLARFYFRRTLRIFPPYYLFLVVLMVLDWRGALALWPGDVGHALTYTTNYHRERSWYTGHAWSLSVEEQFYLLWPFLYRGLGQARATRLLAAYILLAPVWRLTVAFAWPDQALSIGETFLTTADAIACGCWLALQRERLTGHRGYRRIMDSPWYLLLIPALLVSVVLQRFAKLDWAVLITLQNVCIALFVERVTRTRVGWMARVLNARPVVLLGLWSYSLYLWQQLVLNREQSGWTMAFPANLAACLALAVTSYYLIEQPALRLRHRLESRFFPKPASVPHRQVAASDSPPNESGAALSQRPDGR